MSLLRINRNPSRRQLGVFAAAWFVLVGLIGLRAWHHSQLTVAESCAAAAVVVPAVGLAWPRGLRGLYLGLSYATYPIGLVVSSVILTIVYYVVLTPIGLIVRICGHDALERRFDRSAPTYWQKRRPAAGAASYFRQH